MGLLQRWPAVADRMPLAAATIPKGAGATQSTATSKSAATAAATTTVSPTSVAPASPASTTALRLTLAASAGTMPAQVRQAGGQRRLRRRVQPPNLPLGCWHLFVFARPCPWAHMSGTACWLLGDCKDVVDSIFKMAGACLLSTWAAVGETSDPTQSW